MREEEDEEEEEEANAVARRGEGGGLDLARRVETGPALSGDLGGAELSLGEDVPEELVVGASRGVGGPLSRSSR